MGAFGMNMFLLLFPRLSTETFRALDQDKSKESYASYKFLSDSTSHDQRKARSSHGTELYFSFILATQSHVIETMHAVALPLGASLSLIIMFFFFDSLQTVFIICTASMSHLRPLVRRTSRVSRLVLSTMGFAFLLTPCCQMILRPCCDNTK